ncbi:MAG: histidine phosphatase family protein [Actinomycetales bacterium]|nr:histidine phosphatase family protein [Actinomycetales bacterium]
MPLSTVHLMRHGEVFNPDGILYGRLPGYGLSRRGQRMVERVAEVLHSGGHDIRAVVASPLQRAQESAAPTARAFGVPVLADGNLVEATNLFEGLAVNRNRAQLAHPRYWPRYVNPFRPSWGEPYADQVERMTLAVRQALALVPDGGEVLAVSHQLPIWVTRLFLERRPLAHDPRHRQCALASLTTLTFNGRRLVALTYWEPAGDLLEGATDMTPGSSIATRAGMAHHGEGA